MWETMPTVRSKGWIKYIPLKTNLVTRPFLTIIVGPVTCQLTSLQIERRHVLHYPPRRQSMSPAHIQIPHH